MPVNVIDTLKPKNHGTFPVVEAVDVEVSEGKRLTEALAAKADTSSLAALDVAISGKANATDLAATNAALTGKADASALAETNEAVAGKADAADLTELAAEVEQKADATTTTSLQEQINNLITPVTEDAEVENARVGADGTSYTTLKERLDTESDYIASTIESFKNKPLDVGEWVQGKYQFTTGDIEASTTRICTTTKLLFAVGETVHVEVEDGYMFNYIGWQSGESVPSHYSETWLTSGDFTTEVPFYCFMLKKVGDGTIIPSEAENIDIYSDYTLVSVAEKSAWNNTGTGLTNLSNYVDSAFDAIKSKPLTIEGWVNAKYLWTTGALEPDSTRLSSTVKNQFQVGEKVHVEVEEGYQYNYVGWAEGDTVPSHYSETWLNSGEFTTTVPYYCFMLRKTNNGAILPAESSNLKVLSDYTLVSSEEKSAWNKIGFTLSDYKKGLNPINTNAYIWVRGKYSFSTGELSSATNRIATTIKMQVRVGQVLRIKVASGYNVNYVGWETDATVPTHYSSTWPEGNELVVKTKAPYYCFMMRKSDDTSITVREAENADFFIEAVEYGHTYGKYKGKKLSILGDSLSTYGGSPSTPNTNRYSDGTYTYLGNRCRYPQDGSVSGETFLLTDVKQTYWMRLIEDFEMVLGVNESWAGSRVTWDGTTESTDIGATKHIASTTRIGHLGSNGTPDIILINAGTNDIGNAVPIGTFNTDDPSAYTQAEINVLPVATFADAYRTMLIRLQKAYPTSELIVMLPNYTNTYYTPTEADAYCEIIKEACDYFGVKWIDMRTSGVTIYNKMAYLPDGTHYNTDGMDKAFENLADKMLFS